MLSSLAARRRRAQLPTNRLMSSLSHPFDQAISTRPVSPGIRRGTISPDFLIGSAPNGGYVATIALDAARRELEPLGRFPDPISLSGVFLNVAKPNKDVDVHLEHLRIGGRYAVLSVRILQDSTPIFHTLTTFGDYTHEHGPSFPTVAHGPLLPPRHECVRNYMNTRARTPADDYIELYDHPDDHKAPDAGAVAGAAKGDTMETRSWMGFAETATGTGTGAPKRKSDPITYAFWSDVYPPPPAGRFPAQDHWFPTMDFHVQFRAPAKGHWLRCRSYTRFLHNGRYESDNELWDESGTMVCLARCVCVSSCAFASVMGLGLHWTVFGCGGNRQMCLVVPFSKNAKAARQ
ncbi:hypothetical protein M427DRAFT_67982 [Gonapodya prolifera JEL478]|uniref:Thioesterase/thiol ester dehydrase-isomerase n=1 Tax=Gonapodya prolifera (strain JEL478) TaxID=1344416 RepID=A0A139AN26_GONPJ|nr:hypothetical protein M427DRAFT_67982 [Gonapodya prolifera JEL478]|eukprot:KXS18171.1 hypothetical protein M427DRAFT_67982 [Gonapodya prolifera JEL478]